MFCMAKWNGWLDKVCQKWVKSLQLCFYFTLTQMPVGNFKLSTIICDTGLRNTIMDFVKKENAHWKFVVIETMHILICDICTMFFYLYCVNVSHSQICAFSSVWTLCWSVLFFLSFCVWSKSVDRSCASLQFFSKIQVCAVH